MLCDLGAPNPKNLQFSPSRQESLESSRWGALSRCCCQLSRPRETTRTILNHLEPSWTILNHEQPEELHPDCWKVSGTRRSWNSARPPATSWIQPLWRPPSPSGIAGLSKLAAWQWRIWYSNFMWLTCDLNSTWHLVYKRTPLKSFPEFAGELACPSPKTHSDGAKSIEFSSTNLEVWLLPDRGWPCCYMIYVLPIRLTILQSNSPNQPT